MQKENLSALKKITLSGFKSIAANDLSQTIVFDDVNLIIGPNGSGKSNFISFFKMLNHMMTGALQTYIGKNGTSENLLFFGSKKTPILSASLEVKNDNNTDIYDFSLVKAIQDTLIFSAEKITWNGKNIPLSSGQRESFLLSDELAPAPRIVKSLLMKCRVFQFHEVRQSGMMGCDKKCRFQCIPAQQINCSCVSVDDRQRFCLSFTAPVLLL